MNPMWLALIAAAASRGGGRETSGAGPFHLKAGRTYRIRVQIHRTNIAITQAMIDAARVEASKLGINDIRLIVRDGKTFLEATATPRDDLWLPGPGRVPIKYGPLDAEVEYLFARELGPPGV
jgi:hypothetical protein